MDYRGDKPLVRNIFSEEPTPVKTQMPPGEMLCVREGCGHPADWHRLDSSLNISPTATDVPYRCIGYDVNSPGTGECSVSCEDFVPGHDWYDYWRNQR